MPLCKAVNAQLFLVVAGFGILRNAGGWYPVSCPFRIQPSIQPSVVAIFATRGPCSIGSRWPWVSRTCASPGNRAANCVLTVNVRVTHIDPAGCAVYAGHLPPQVLHGHARRPILWSEISHWDRNKLLAGRLTFHVRVYFQQIWEGAAERRPLCLRSGTDSLPRDKHLRPRYVACTEAPVNGDFAGPPLCIAAQTSRDIHVCELASRE